MEGVRIVEFNNGFVTALCLFYAHRENDFGIYGAADHLYDIEYPENLDSYLRRKIQRFVDNVFEVRLKRISSEKAEKLFERCLELIMEIDKKHFNLDVQVFCP